MSSSWVGTVGFIQGRLRDQLGYSHREINGVGILSFQVRDVIRQLRRECPGLRAWVAGIVSQSCAGRVDCRNNFCATITGIYDEKNVQ